MLRTETVSNASERRIGLVFISDSPVDGKAAGASIMVGLENVLGSTKRPRPLNCLRERDPRCRQPQRVVYGSYRLRCNRHCWVYSNRAWNDRAIHNEQAGIKWICCSGWFVAVEDSSEIIHDTVGNSRGNGTAPKRMSDYQLVISE